MQESFLNPHIHGFTVPTNIAILYCPSESLTIVHTSDFVKSMCHKIYLRRMRHKAQIFSNVSSTNPVNMDYLRMSSLTKANL